MDSEPAEVDSEAGAGGGAEAISGGFGDSARVTIPVA